MLTDLNGVLMPAKNNGYAVGLFNVVNSEMARGVISAAKELGAPLIIGTAERFLDFVPLSDLADILIPMAKRADIPVVIHFDHGKTKENCLKAIDCGFTSIMYDCSRLPYEENVKNMADIVKIAHERGVTVEGELGAVMDLEGSIEGEPDSLSGKPEDYYTDPDVAYDFVSRTGVDALAVSVGNAHGAYKFPPKLDFDRIDAINKRLSIPLVLHGGSGLTDEDFRRAISLGIAKVNIFTDINEAAAKAAAVFLKNSPKNYAGTLNGVENAVKVCTREKLKLFMSENKGAVK